MDDAVFWPILSWPPLSATLISVFAQTVSATLCVQFREELPGTDDYFWNDQLLSFTVGKVVCP